MGYFFYQKVEPYGYFLSKKLKYFSLTKLKYLSRINKMTTIQTFGDKVVMLSNSSGISAAEIAVKQQLILAEDIPEGGFVKRNRWQSNEQLTRLTAELGINLADIVLDEEKENFNDYIKYCLNFLEYDDDEDAVYIKEWLRDFDENNLEGYNWWHSENIVIMEEIIRRSNDTRETMANTLRTLQNILRVKEEQY
jgi:hypothetical protein